MNTWPFIEVCIGIVLGVILIRKHLIDIIVFQGIQFLIWLLVTLLLYCFEMKGKVFIIYMFCGK